MTLNKHLKNLFLIVIVFILIPLKIEATNDVNIHFFWRDGCPHCNTERAFLRKITNKYPQITVYDYETASHETQKILKDIETLLDTNFRGVPFTVIGDQTFTGFSISMTGSQIEKAITYYLNNPYRDYVGEMLGIVKAPSNDSNSESTDNNNNSSYQITLPIIGTINLAQFSLPIITIILGLIDGFNPCALWILILLISILIGMNDRRKMFILGMTFILASAFIYFLFMTSWLQVVLVLKSLFWLKLFIIAAALLGGLYHLKAYFSAPKSGCEVTNERQQQKILTHIKNFTSRNNLLLGMIGITILAISVNLIELLCSVGIPLVYIQILVLNNVTHISYYWYLLLYLFFFMLDHIIIFTIAMVTFKLKGISTKYTKYNHLIGGLLMILIALLMAFKPDWLMFG